MSNKECTLSSKNFQGSGIEMAGRGKGSDINPFFSPRQMQLGGQRSDLGQIGSYPAVWNSGKALETLEWNAPESSVFHTMVPGPYLGREGLSSEGITGGKARHCFEKTFPLTYIMLCALGHNVKCIFYSGSLSRSL